MKLRVIGDVHGCIEIYLNLINSSNKCDASIQLGDMGFRDNYKALANGLENDKIDSNKHVFIGGNHDDYDHRPPTMLPDFGQIKFSQDQELKMFYIRGAESIDKKYRVEGVSWWRAEQLNYRESEKAFDAYCRFKPDIMFTHDCPWDILSYFITNSMKKNGSSTNHLLRNCFEIHQPKFWYFGHHHQTKKMELKGTAFQCLNELNYLDLEI